MVNACGQQAPPLPSLSPLLLFLLFFFLACGHVATDLLRILLHVGDGSQRQAPVGHRAPKVLQSGKSKGTSSPAAAVPQHVQGRQALFPLIFSFSLSDPASRSTNRAHEVLAHLGLLDIGDGPSHKRGRHPRTLRQKASGGGENQSQVGAGPLFQGVVTVGKKLFILAFVARAARNFLCLRWAAPGVFVYFLHWSVSPNETDGA